MADGGGAGEEYEEFDGAAAAGDGAPEDAEEYLEVGAEDDGGQGEGEEDDEDQDEEVVLGAHLAGGLDAAKRRRTAGDRSCGRDGGSAPVSGGKGRGGGRGGGRSFGRAGGRGGGYLRAYDVADSDDEKADRDQQLLQDACLPVSGAPLPPSAGAPQNADEYLRQVQWERMHCQSIVDVEIDPEHAGGKRRGVSGGLLRRLNLSEAFSNEEARHSSEWAEDVAAAFAALRAGSERARQAAPGGSTARLTYAQWKERLENGSPSTAMLVQQNFISINRLVGVATDLLEKSLKQGGAAEEGAAEDGAAEGAEADEAEVAAALAGCVAAAPSARGPDVPAAVERLDLHRFDRAAEWVFAALAFLEMPLFDDIQFQLQRLRRLCGKLLVAMQSDDATAEVDGGDRTRGAVLARASLLLVLVTETFGQR